jgi:hypothetical protein
VSYNFHEPQDDTLSASPGVTPGAATRRAKRSPAALRNGLSEEEVVEVLLQTAVYHGVPAANSPSRSRRACSPWD